MKKTIIVIISIIIVITIGFGIYMFYNNAVNKEANQGTNITENDDNRRQQNIINEINNTYIPNNTYAPVNTSVSSNTVTVPVTPVETEIASFSTNLSGDSARLNNISITCNTINGTTISNGESFSFNSIVGQPSSAKGYQEADVIVDKKIEKGYGGGNCQVSTTIYNAALEIDGIEVTERHPHKKKVTYIEEGKDAAVSYSGGLDLKFTNNTGNDIKIYVSSDGDSVDARIVKLS